MLVNDLIGNFGKYQLWICFLIFVNKIGIAFHQMANIFLAAPTNYTCPNNEACCDNPVFDTSIYTRTIATEWVLICEKAWLNDFNQTVFQFGNLLGSLFFGILSDRYGRKPTLIICVIIEVFTGVMTSFLPDYWSFTIVRMICGFSLGGVTVIGFVIVMEYVGAVHRDVISALYQVPFTMGHMLLALLGYFIRDYMYFQLIISLSMAVLLFYICFLPETPRYLLARNRVSEAVELIESVAKFNNLPSEDIQRQVELYHLEHNRAGHKKETFIDLFRTPNIRRNNLVMSFAWFVCSYCYYGVSQYISHLTGNVYLNVFACGAVATGACFTSIPLIRLMKRRNLLVLANICSGVCLFIIAIIPEGIASTVFGCIGVWCSFSTFILVYLYCSEMFPTVVRNAALGFSSMMARVGAMIAPFVASLRPHGQWVAPIAFGTLPFVAAGLSLMLPETKDCELLMTIEEGEALGKKISPKEGPSGVN